LDLADFLRCFSLRIAGKLPQLLWVLFAGAAVSDPVSANAPQPRLGRIDAIAIVVGIIIGAGIFSTPSIVAGNVSSPGAFIAAWILGGIISLIGALCYAELASTYPDAGGDYHFLHRAYGSSLAFLYAWARLAVIQTGSIAIQAFIIGDYATQVLGLGPFSSSLYAAIIVVLFTALNIAGIRQSKTTQNLLTAFEVLCVVTIIVAGLSVRHSPSAPLSSSSSGGAFGLAMVMVLLTYGGWSESAYLSAELKGSRRRVVSVIGWSIGIVTAIYLLANVAYLRGLGLSGLASSQAPAADLLSHLAGSTGARLIGLMIVISAASTVNATIFTGARTNYALGRDFAALAPIGRWNGRADTPTNALVLQGVITLALVGFGAFKREGFKTMVDYTAPVFWFFLLMVAIGVFVLRFRNPRADRPFTVPFYPVTPLIFCAACAYMLHASLNYTGIGALVGVAVLIAGVPLMLLMRAPRPCPALNPET
jgi:amino acid transporter